MAKKKKFGGELDEPLPPLRVGWLMTDEEKRKTIADHVEPFHFAIYFAGFPFAVVNVPPA